MSFGGTRKYGDFSSHCNSLASACLFDSAKIYRHRKTASSRCEKASTSKQTTKNPKRLTLYGVDICICIKFMFFCCLLCRHITMYPGIYWLDVITCGTLPLSGYARRQTDSHTKFDGLCFTRRVLVDQATIEPKIIRKTKTSTTVLPSRAVLLLMFFLLLYIPLATLGLLTRDVRNVNLFVFVLFCCDYSGSIYVSGKCIGAT